MSEHDRAILADYCEWRMVKTRKVLQIILEVPLEHQEEVAGKLGFPLPDRDIAVAVCRIDEMAASDYRAQRQRSRLSVVGKQQYENASEMGRACIRAKALARDAEFIVWANKASDFINVHDEQTAKQFIHEWCGVRSRNEIGHDRNAYLAYLRLEAKFEEAVGRRPEKRA